MGFIGVTGIIIYMVTFVIFYITAALDDNPANNPAGGMRMFPEKWLSAAAAVPNVLLAVTYQTNFYPVLKGLKNGNDTRMARAALCAVMFCAVSYLIIGILGYNYMGDQKISANFL